MGEEVSKDEWSPANTQIKAVSNNSAFEAAGVPVECQTFAMLGKTPAGNGTTFTEAEAQAETAVEPKVENCNHPTEVSKTWHVQFHSNGKGFEGQCTVDKDGSDDCVTLHLPAEAAKIKLGICTAVVNAQEIVALYEDEELEAGKKNTSIEVNEIPVKIKGCIGVTTAKFKGLFKVTTEAQGQPLLTDA
ncbi:MAG TPA: hypothetical protein VGY76_07170 [Solirubrobacteraceae bacterium]|nr:hypothetical protein [Solirubrobacteraceae bacterium]